MQNDSLDYVLSKAVKALGSIQTNKINKLPLLEGAFILNELPDVAELRIVRKQLADQLYKQLNGTWIERGNLYVVFTVLTALWQYDPSSITGKNLASMVQRLIKSEVTVGGPYASAGVISITANAQIAIFMHKLAKPLPKLDDFLKPVIAARSFDSTELTVFGLIYLLSKASDNPELTKYVASHWKQNDWQTPMRISVALSILRNKIPPEQIQSAFNLLRKRQRSSGFWNSESLLKSTASKESSTFITTAHITGVLSNILTNYRPAGHKASLSDLERKHRAIARAARQRFSVHADPLRSSALKIVNGVCKTNKNFEITILSHFFTKALRIPTPLTNQQHITLGLASLCGWIAYTIYDDFLDDEGEPAKLSIANVAMRASLDYFREALPEHEFFHHYVARIFDAMDEANAWEVSNCRFAVRERKVTISQLPKYGNQGMLAARSFPHALAPIAILILQPGGISKLHYSESAFRYYLIARQLNDDLRDWHKDMQAGQASYVVTAILRDLRAHPGTYSLSDLLPRMQKNFRQTTMPKVCGRILWHISASRQAFIKSQLLRTTNDIYLLLDNLEKTVQHSLDTHSKTHVFYECTTKFDLRR